MIDQMLEWLKGRMNYYQNEKITGQKKQQQITKYINGWHSG